MKTQETQRAPKPFDSGLYFLNHIRDSCTICGVFLNQGVLGSLGTESACYLTGTPSSFRQAPLGYRRSGRVRYLRLIESRQGLSGAINAPIEGCVFEDPIRLHLCRCISFSSYPFTTSVLIVPPRPSKMPMLWLQIH